MYPYGTSFHCNSFCNTSLQASEHYMQILFFFSLNLSVSHLMQKISSISDLPGIKPNWFSEMPVPSINSCLRLITPTLHPLNSSIVWTTHNITFILVQRKSKAMPTWLWHSSLSKDFINSSTIYSVPVLTSVFQASVGTLSGLNAFLYSILIFAKETYLGCHNVYHFNIVYITTYYWCPRNLLV